MCMFDVRRWLPVTCSPPLVFKLDNFLVPNTHFLQYHFGCAESQL